MLTSWKVRIASRMQFCQQFNLFAEHFKSHIQTQNTFCTPVYSRIKCTYILCFMLTLHLFYHEIAKIQQILAQYKIIGLILGLTLWLSLTLSLSFPCHLAIVLLIYVCVLRFVLISVSMWPSFNGLVRHVESKMKNALDVERQVSETFSPKEKKIYVKTNEKKNGEKSATIACNWWNFLPNKNAPTIENIPPEHPIPSRKRKAMQWRSTFMGHKLLHLTKLKCSLASVLFQNEMDNIDIIKIKVVRDKKKKIKSKNEAEILKCPRFFLYALSFPILWLGQHTKKKEKRTVDFKWIERKYGRECV